LSGRIHKYKDVGFCNYALNAEFNSEQERMTTLLTRLIIGKQNYETCNAKFSVDRYSIVEVCDTTVFNSSTKIGTKKII
jgi:hypothetical protein